jgi:hypothetical protein
MVCCNDEDDPHHSKYTDQDCSGDWSECDEHCKRYYTRSDSDTLACGWEEQEEEDCLADFPFPGMHAGTELEEEKLYKVDQEAGLCTANLGRDDACEYYADRCGDGDECYINGISWPGQEDIQSEPNTCGIGKDGIEDLPGVGHWYSDKNYAAARQPETWGSDPGQWTEPLGADWNNHHAGAFAKWDYRGAIDVPEDILEGAWSYPIEECPISLGPEGWQTRETACKCDYGEGHTIDHWHADPESPTEDSSSWRCVDVHEDMGLFDDAGITDPDHLNDPRNSPWTVAAADVTGTDPAKWWTGAPNVHVA